MKTVNQLLSEKLKLYELDGLFKEVRKVQRYTFKQAVDFYIAEKNRTEGKAFTEKGSLAATAVNRFEKRLTDAIEKNAGYRSEIRKYMTNFDKMDVLNSRVHKLLNKINIDPVIALANKQKRELVGGTVEKIVGEIKRFPENMLGDEMRQQFTKPVKKVLYQNIMQGKSQSAAKKALHKFIIGDKGKIGQLERWSGQIARDTLSQYDGAVNDMVRKEFDLNGFKYIGSLVRDSRPQCVRWKRMIEIPTKVLPRELSNFMNRGQIPGTNINNFATYKGGYNCAHQAIAIRMDAKNIKVSELMSKSNQSGPQIDKLGKNLAKKYNGKVTPINFKGRDSIIRKTKDLGGDINKINDSVRNTVVVSPEKMNSVFKDLKSDPGIFSVNKQLPKDYMGYSGIISKVKTKNGIMGEVQVNTAKMIYAKEKPGIAQSIIGKSEWNKINKSTGLPGGVGHKYYEEYRKLDPLKFAKERKRFAKLSEEYYSHFR